MSTIRVVDRETAFYRDIVPSAPCHCGWVRGLGLMGPQSTVREHRGGDVWIQTMGVTRHVNVESAAEERKRLAEEGRLNLLAYAKRQHDLSLLPMVVDIGDGRQLVLIVTDADADLDWVANTDVTGWEWAYGASGPDSV